MASDSTDSPKAPASVTFSSLSRRKIVHPQKTMSAQCVFGIAMEYEDLNDHQTLCDEIENRIKEQVRPR